MFSYCKILLADMSFLAWKEYGRVEIVTSQLLMCIRLVILKEREYYAENVKATSRCSRWCVMDDFNSIRRSEEKIGVDNRSQYGREMKEFIVFIEDMELIDIPLVG